MTRFQSFFASSLISVNFLFLSLHPVSVSAQVPQELLDWAEPTIDYAVRSIIDIAFGNVVDLAYTNYAYFTDMYALANNAVNSSQNFQFGSACGYYIFDGNYYLSCGSFYEGGSGSALDLQFNVVNSSHGYIEGNSTPVGYTPVIVGSISDTGVYLRNSTSVFMGTFCNANLGNQSVGLTYSVTSPPSVARSGTRPCVYNSNFVFGNSYISRPNISFTLPSSNSLSDYQSSVDEINLKYPDAPHLPGPLDDVSPTDTTYPDSSLPYPAFPPFVLPPDLPSPDFPDITFPTAPPSVIEETSNTLLFHFRLLNMLFDKFGIGWVAVLMLSISLLLLILSR